MKRALISVSDKQGLEEFSHGLIQAGWQLLSTGGTAAALRGYGLPVTDVAEVTGFPECLDGRVKTLHPAVHAGILARRDLPEHMETLHKLNIEPIDLVVVNLYPFKQTVSRPAAGFDECIENIDIGGPTLLRAAAKNHSAVTVVCDPADYAQVLAQLQTRGETTLEFRRELAAKVFAHTAAYDSLIADYLHGQTAKAAGTARAELFPEQLTLTFEKQQDLRYGENSHQSAAFYKVPLLHQGSLPGAVQLHGKELSYNNISDADAALAMLREFERPAVVAVKHANPCGIAVRDNLDEAWDKAYEADPVSIFGGIVAANREITAAMAEKMSHIFLEIVIAPSFSAEALTILEKKKNIRLLQLPVLKSGAIDGQLIYKSVYDGLLIQTADNTLWDESALCCVTQAQPDPEAWKDAAFGMTVVKHVKSNGICVVKNEQTLGIGPGQVNRITAAEIALKQAGDKARGAVLASDAFFPFDDCVRLAARYGIQTVVQPGGSLKDQDSIKACDELDICMLMTGTRHFRH
ncbi:bifunctional phosphoribosylaminoimidazolecarboxamide formyltransferase/IMP cyclohydrolase [Oscillospiraceae bacterium HV4-5-C5C]|nr:bifunctional phosphoribosylaminoimidazolecarboxamide formyltransferase/IMP cyclohydrolase [Oscillospiraceae bacterium HV4-5-C5C]